MNFVNFCYSKKEIYCVINVQLMLQTSLKDMTSLYSLLEERIKMCKDREMDNEASPDKKIALENNE